MGLAKDALRCLAGCMIKLKCKCKSGCCQSDCMAEEGPAPSPVLPKKESTNKLRKRNSWLSTV